MNRLLIPPVSVAPRPAARTTRGTLLLSAIVAGFLFVSAQTANATVIEFDATGSSGNQPVDATALFTTSAGSLTVVLTNLEVNPKSISESISGIEFQLSNTPKSAAVSSDTGQLINLSGSVATPIAGTPNRWSAALSKGTIDLSALGGGQPSQLIIGPGPYTNANSGFTKFNPQVSKTATFGLTISGISSTTTITSATFLFGTNPDGTIVGHSVRTPEPASIALLASSMVAIGLLRRKQRR